MFFNSRHVLQCIFNSLSCSVCSNSVSSVHLQHVQDSWWSCTQADDPWFKTLRMVQPSTEEASFSTALTCGCHLQTLPCQQGFCSFFLTVTWVTVTGLYILVLMPLWIQADGLRVEINALKLIWSYMPSTTWCTHQKLKPRNLTGI